MSAVAFREMSTAESMRVLRRNNVGRIAYALRNRVEVQPIHYVTDGRWLYIRTSPGTKTSALARNRWLALQADEVESPLSWRSVIVRGTAYVLSPDATPDLASRYTRAVRRIGRVIPRAFTVDDPVSFRSVVLGIHIEEISGRAAHESQERPRAPSRRSTGRATRSRSGGSRRS